MKFQKSYIGFTYNLAYKIYGKRIGGKGIPTNTKRYVFNNQGGLEQTEGKEKRYLKKILLFCYFILVRYRWILNDDRFTFAVAGLGYMALTGWVFRFGGRADQDISSEVQMKILYMFMG